MCWLQVLELIVTLVMLEITIIIEVQNHVIEQKQKRNELLEYKTLVFMHLQKDCQHDKHQPRSNYK